LFGTPSSSNEYTRPRCRPRGRSLEDSNTPSNTLKSLSSKLPGSKLGSSGALDGAARQGHPRPSDAEGANLDRGDNAVESMPGAESDGGPLRSPGDDDGPGGPSLRAVRPRAGTLFCRGRAHTGPQGTRARGGRCSNPRPADASPAGRRGTTTSSGRGDRGQGGSVSGGCRRCCLGLRRGGLRGGRAGARRYRRSRPGVRAENGCPRKHAGRESDRRRRR
jgi:hypothetical protein